MSVTNESIKFQVIIALLKWSWEHGKNGCQDGPHMNKLSLNLKEECLKD